MTEGRKQRTTNITYSILPMTERIVIKNITIVNEGQTTLSGILIEKGVTQRT